MLRVLRAALAAKTAELHQIYQTNLAAQTAGFTQGTLAAQSAESSGKQLTHGSANASRNAAKHAEYACPGAS